MIDVTKYSLKLSSHEWDRVLEHLVRNPGGLMVGPTGSCDTEETQGLLVRWLENSSESKLPDWIKTHRHFICILPQREIQVAKLLSLVASSNPSLHHSITAIAMGVGQSAGRLSALQYRNGHWHPIDQLSVTTSGLPIWNLSSRLSSHREIVEAIPEQWSRTVGAMGLEAWSHLSHSRIAIVGCGRTGSEMAESLSLLGVSKLLLIDPDRIEPGNLDAMRGIVPADVGRFKVEAVAERLCQMRPDMAVTAIKASVLETHAWKRLKEYDLIVSTVDRDEARWVAARIASLYLLPHLDVGTGVHDVKRDRVMGADLRLMIPGEFCLLCAGGLRKLDEAIYHLRAPINSLKQGGPVQWKDQRAGSLVSLNAMATGLGLQLWLDYLAGRLQGSQWLRLEWSAFGAPRIEPQTISRAQDCVLCQQRGLGDLALGA